MVSLICEGQCNPTLPNFDSAAEVYAEVRQDGLDAVSDDLARYLERERKKLTYTPHAHRYGDTWACGVCGCERRYPGPLWTNGRVA